VTIRAATRPASQAANAEAMPRASDIGASDARTFADTLHAKAQADGRNRQADGDNTSARPHSPQADKTSATSGSQAGSLVISGSGFLPEKPAAPVSPGNSPQAAADAADGARTPAAQTNGAAPVPAPPPAPDTAAADALPQAGDRPRDATARKVEVTIADDSGGVLSSPIKASAPAPASAPARSVASKRDEKQHPAAESATLSPALDTLPAAAIPQAGASDDTNAPPGTAAIGAADMRAEPPARHVSPDINAAPDGTAATSDMAPVQHAAAAATPAAVGGTPPGAAPAVSAGELKDWLSQPIVHLVASSRREMTIQLRPPELGVMTVRVAVNGKNVSAWFETPQSQVQQVIAQAIPQLHADLGAAGYALTGAWVGADAGNGSAPQPAPMVPLPRVEARGRSLLTEAAAIRRRNPASPSGVNIYV